MIETPTKQNLLTLIHTEWEALQATLAQLSQSQMTQIGVENNWSVKDILAHITAWESLMVQWIEESLRGEVPDRPPPSEDWDGVDTVNEKIYQENKAKSLDIVLTDFQQTHQKAVETITAMTEDDLLDPNRFEWRQGTPMWELVMANTWDHYQEHQKTISNWLNNNE